MSRFRAMAAAPGRRLAAVAILLFVAVGLLLPSALRAETLPELAIGDLSQRTLHAPVEWRQGGATLAAVRELPFAPLHAGGANRGLTTKPYWLRVRLVNDTAEAVDWVITHEASYLDHFDIFYRDGSAADGHDGIWQEVNASNTQPFGSRPLHYRKLGWSHTTAAGGHTDLYLRMQHTQRHSLTLNVDWATAAAFQQRALDDALVSGLYYGMMLLITVVALSGSLILRQAAWAYYGLFLIASTLVWAMNQGFAFQYLWPGWVYWNHDAYLLIFLLVPLTGLQFSKLFLSTARLMPRLHRLLAWVQIAILIAMPLHLLGERQVVTVVAYAALGSMLLLPVGAWIAWRRGLSYARWYLLAWLLYLASFLLSVLAASTNLLSWGMQPLLWAQLASLVEALLLLIGLAEGLLIWERERKFALAAAFQDPLTGLGNRRRLLQAFDALQMRRGRDREEPWFLAMLDLDSFKAINDSFGHDAGDRILCEFARLLRRHIRHNDVAIRYGGEEFAILLQAPSLAAAHGILERVRTEFGNHPTHYNGLLIPHSFSAGLIAVPLHQGQLAPEALIHRADAALYRAKAAGRDRIVLVEPQQEREEAPSATGTAAPSAPSNQG